MGMEPLGSVMTYQAQPAVKEDKALNQSTAQTMDVSAQEYAKQVDETNKIVNKLDENQEEKDLGEQEQRQPSHEQLKKAVENLNKKMNNSEALFGIHEKTNRVTIKIVNKETKELIKEFPPEKTLDMIAKAWELAGILVDEKR